MELREEERREERLLMRMRMSERLVNLFLVAINAWFILQEGKCCGKIYLPGCMISMISHFSGKIILKYLKYHICLDSFLSPFAANV